MSLVRVCVWVVLAAVAVGSASGQGVMLGRGVAPLAGAPPGAQEDGVVLPPASVGAALVDMGSRADVVFVGQVQKIEPRGGVVEVVFAVEQPVMGSLGGRYTLREWAGLWTGGRTRYYVGQRAMVFLHAAGPSNAGPGGGAGLSSPVDGMDGVVPVVVQGADAQPLVDVRWLAARVERQVGVPLGGAETGAISLADALAMVRDGNKVKLPEPVRLPLPIRPMPIVAGGEAGARLERVQ